MSVKQQAVKIIIENLGKDLMGRLGQSQRAGILIVIGAI